MAVTNTFLIEIDGRKLADDIDLASVVVEDHLHLPDSFSVTIRDASRRGLDICGATIGGELKIAVLNDASPTPVLLIKGEITALEAEIHHGTSFTHIRGYDQSHKLLRGRMTVAYSDYSYVDVAKDVAARNGLGVGKVGEKAPTHPHVTQANENDWDFLRRLGAESGYEVTVSDGKLNFHPPVDASAAPSSGDLTTENSLQLLVGDNILELRATLTSAEQVAEVEARGWNPITKKAVVATAKVKTDTVQNGLKPADLGGKFRGSKLVTNEPAIATDADAKIAAEAAAEAVAAVCTEMEGIARGDAKLKAGTAVLIGLLGKPFDGKYVLTTTRHCYDKHEGYVTSFAISGRSERSLLGLTGGGTPSSRIAGVVPAIVEDLQDPDDSGRVRLRFPWMDEKFKSAWARVAHVGAGKNRGFLILPEVGDEVLVAFEQGDVRRPYVIAGLYNGVDTVTPPPSSLLDGSSHAVNKRMFRSREGHLLVFDDTGKTSGIALTTADGKIEIKLDETAKKIEIKSSGDIVVKADGSISFEATKSFTLKAQEVLIEGQTKATVKAQQVSVEADVGAKVKGATVSVEGSGPVTIKGAQVSLN
jgi:phage protein D/phage baseplate assembly protein gpV